MLDLGFVRENLDAVRQAMADRSFPADVLDRFAQMDADRRRIIGEADSVNQRRNAASKEIGALMQSGQKDAAEARSEEHTSELQSH